jgi:hypothetical protein
MFDRSAGTSRRRSSRKRWRCQRSKGPQAAPGRSVWSELSFVSEAAGARSGRGTATACPFAVDPVRARSPIRAPWSKQLPRDFLEEHKRAPAVPGARGAHGRRVGAGEPVSRRGESSGSPGIRRCRSWCPPLREIESSTLRSYLPAANVFVIDDIYEDIDDADFSVIEKQVTETGRPRGSGRATVPWSNS